MPSTVRKEGQVTHYSQGLAALLKAPTVVCGQVLLSTTMAGC